METFSVFSLRTSSLLFFLLLFLHPISSLSSSSSSSSSSSLFQKQFPLIYEWSAEVVVSATLKNRDGDEMNIIEGLAKEYASFKTLRHAVVMDASLRNTDLQYCLGLGAVSYTSQQVEESWNTPVARVIYNETDCAYAVYNSTLSSLNYFSWLACNLRAFGFETVICSNEAAIDPIVPTYMGGAVFNPPGFYDESYCDLWQWELAENNEVHKLYTRDGSGSTSLYGYEWTGITGDGCNFTEWIVFNTFVPGTPEDTWFQNPPSGLDSCTPLPFTTGFCSFDTPGTTCEEP